MVIAGLLLGAEVVSMVVRAVMVSVVVGLVG
jgi:hypothetical protein